MKLKLVNNKWIELPDNSKEGFYLDGKIKQRCDRIIQIIKKICPGRIKSRERPMAIPMRKNILLAHSTWAGERRPSWITRLPPLNGP